MHNKTIIILLCTILTSVLVFGIILLDSLNNCMNNITGQMANMINISASNINSSLGTLRLNMEEMLKKQTSIIADYSFTCGNLTADTLKCNVAFTVVPKEFTESTTAAILIDGEKTDMVRNGNCFNAIATLSVLKNYKNISVVFSQNGINKTEFIPINEDFNLSDKIKKFISIESIETSMEAAKNGTQSDHTHKIIYAFNSGFGEKAVPSKITASIDGDVIFSDDLPLPSLSAPQEYSFNTKNTKTIDICIETVGTSGLTYRISFSYGRDEDNIKEAYTKVYDKDGKEIVLD